MKNGHSLEEQRRALLEQIHASRSIYREMLSDGGKKRGKSAQLDGAAGAPAGIESLDPEFPRSKTMRWILDHPYLAAAAMVGVSMAVPKLFGAGRGAAQRLQEKKRRKAAAQQEEAYRQYREQYGSAAAYPPPPPPYYAQPPSARKVSAWAGIAAFGGTALTSLLTIGTMLLRDPARLQAAMRIVSQAGAYIGNYKAQHGRQASMHGSMRRDATRTTNGARDESRGGLV